MNTNFQIQLSVEDDEFSYQNYSQNLNLSEAEEKKEKDPFDISMSELSNMETSPSQIKYGLSLDENEENQKELETCKNKIFRTDIKGENDRLIMNRISARKSRLKKKKYIKQLEEESAVLKNNFLLNNINKNSSLGEYSEMNKLFLNKINLLESQEKEIKAEGQKKCANLMKQYESLQKTILNLCNNITINLFSFRKEK